ncbi:MAG: hypothetical protein UR43_C0010G0027 [candidate division TM6 bacterium GW2011_GWF2_33_332]|nr:MAG: hypothetical protein UR43_C0010G0027 [candidate division TM6 bacterium GW2011_GWF2_33_332]
MKLTVIIIFWMLNCFSVFSQKMPSDYFDEGVKFMGSEKTKEAILSFKYIVDNHPRNELYPRAFYNLGYIYYQDKQYGNAKQIFKSILNSMFNEKEALGGDIMADPYTNYRHRAAILLHQIYYDTKDYDSSLYYLALSDTAYPYLHFCGNEYAANEVFMSLRYADVYEKLGNLTKAKQALLKSVFVNLADNTKVIEELKRLFEKEKGEKGLKKELEKALENIYPRKETRNNKEYTRYYFKFQETEIAVPFNFFDSDNFDKSKTIAQIKQTELYKMIKEL